MTAMKAAELAFDIAHQGSPQAEVFFRTPEGVEYMVTSVRALREGDEVRYVVEGKPVVEEDLTAYLETLG